MQYNNIFRNGNLRIKVCTNSRRICKLIENFLDFDNNLCHSKPKIKINFYLDEIGLKNTQDGEKFLFQEWLDKDRNLLFSIGKRIATVETNPKAGIVKATILKFKESCKERILDYIFTRPLRFILAHHELFSLHASVVCKGKDCILIIGPQNSGKSTLALTLAQSGFNLLSDDKCFVKLVRGQIQLLPFPTKMGLNEKILKKYPELNKHILKNYRFGGKCRVSLNSISNSNNTKNLKCKMIIFPKYKADRNISMRKTSKEEALNRLMKKHSVIQKKEFQKMFWALYSLTNKANAFELIYSDAELGKIPKVVNKNFV